MNEGKLKHDIIKELWLNRPWVYLPNVWYFMRDYPLKNGDNFWLWIRNCFYLNWVVWFKEVRCVRSEFD